MDNCGYYCVEFTLFLGNYVQCKEITCYFSLKGGDICNKIGGWLLIKNS